METSIRYASSSIAVSCWSPAWPAPRRRARSGRFGGALRAVLQRQRAVRRQVRVRAHELSVDGAAAARRGRTTSRAARSTSSRSSPRSPTTRRTSTASSIMRFSDPELFKFPVVYLVEPGLLVHDRQRRARTLRDYLRKGGFLIVDDFRGRRLGQLRAADEPGVPGRPVDRARRRRIRSSIRSSRSTRSTSSRRPTTSAAGRCSSRCSRTTTRTSGCMIIANYQNDMSEFWECSDTGYYTGAGRNEAYKIGINSSCTGSRTRRVEWQRSDVERHPSLIDRRSIHDI